MLVTSIAIAVLAVCAAAYLIIRSRRRAPKPGPNDVIMAAPHDVRRGEGYFIDGTFIVARCNAKKGRKFFGAVDGIIMVCKEIGVHYPVGSKVYFKNGKACGIQTGAIWGGVAMREAPAQSDICTIDLMRGIIRG